jgi:hypothetical protein
MAICHQHVADVQRDRQPRRPYRQDLQHLARPKFRVQSMADETAKGTLHEWQTEALNTAAANAQLQGDDVAFGAAILTTRIGNRTQISRKEVIVSGTQEAVDKAGRNSEMVRQMANKRAELKRDRSSCFARTRLRSRVTRPLPRSFVRCCRGTQRTSAWRTSAPTVRPRRLALTVRSAPSRKP